MGAHFQAFDIVRGLLKDEGVGSEHACRGRFREAVLSGVDISRAVPDLRRPSRQICEKACGPSPCPVFCEAWRRLVAESLLSHKDKDIRRQPARQSSTAATAASWPDCGGRPKENKAIVLNLSA